MGKYKIAVIGCGPVGLMSALAIQKDLKSAAKVTIFTELLSPHTTADVSAGLWGPFLLQDTKPENVIRWSKATYDYFLDLWKRGYADEAGICMQLVMRVFQNNMKLPTWTNILLGHQIIPAKEIERLNSLLKKDYKFGFSYVGLSFEPTKFLPFLQKKFLRRGGEIVIQKITDFSQLSGYDVVVNCTGLYSQILANDKQMMPIRGQVARVDAPWHFHTILDDENYVIVNYNTIVLGGTAQTGDYSTDPRDCDTKKILDGCYNITPTLKNAAIIKHAVGLRPGRPEVRLDLEMKRIDGKDLKIIHNYGHGGSGVTLSYGCALDAAKLVKQALNIQSRSKL